MGNQPYNQSMYDYMMDNFKKNVRYILDSIIHYADYCPGMCEEEKIPDYQKDTLKKFERDFKAFCIELYEDVTKYVSKIGDVNKRMNDFLKQHHCRPIWVTDEHDCLPQFNSMHIYLYDLDFDYKEEAHDEYMAEMAETKGRGYDYYKFQIVDPDLTSRDFCEERRHDRFVRKLRNRFGADSTAYFMDADGEDETEDEDLPF